MFPPSLFLPRSSVPPSLLNFTPSPNLISYDSILCCLWAHRYRIMYCCLNFCSWSTSMIKSGSPTPCKHQFYETEESKTPQKRIRIRKPPTPSMHSQPLFAHFATVLSYLVKNGSQHAVIASGSYNCSILSSRIIPKPQWLIVIYH